MHTIQPQSLTINELLRHVNTLLIESEVGDKRGLPIEWQWELARRLEGMVSAAPRAAVMTVDPRQGNLF